MTELHPSVVFVNNKYEALNTFLLILATPVILRFVIDPDYVGG